MFPLFFHSIPVSGTFVDFCLSSLVDKKDVYIRAFFLTESLIIFPLILPLSDCVYLLPQATKIDPSSLVEEGQSPTAGL